MPDALDRTVDPSLLATIAGPEQVRTLDAAALRRLAAELRSFLLHSVSTTGGHLASNLGSIELTVALHHVYDLPRDRLVWDVGHQTYAHKVLTGRREAMAQLRKFGGISGFPRRCESPYDAFGTAHSSTSISAALGMAEAARLKGEPRQVVAVIGDGAMSGGMAFEAMNNAGVSGCDLTVILNDNEMSISPAVGALNRHLARLLDGPLDPLRRAGTGLRDALPAPLKRLVRRAEEHAKGLLGATTLFEELGFHYVGPIDGHDLDVLVPILRALRSGSGPRLLHVVTRKGCGYARAEHDPVLYHGVPAFHPPRGLDHSPSTARPAYSQVFGDWLCEAAQADDRVVGITPAMREGSGMVRFAREHPSRFFDVGIAEQHAVTFAAGLACEGLRPVVAIYSTFLQRGYDQLIHDVCLQDLPVVFALDRGGLAGADGATHHGAFDLSYLRAIPNLTVMAPADEDECRRMLSTGLALDGPSAVRYPRGSGPGAAIAPGLPTLPVGRAEVRRRGARVALLAFGSMLATALEVGEALDATVVNMRFVKPLDVELILALAARHELLVTLEENAVAGGAGSGVAEALAAAGRRTALVHVGLPDQFVEHGEGRQLLAALGLDAAAITARLRARLGPPRRTSRRTRSELAIGLHAARAPRPSRHPRALQRRR